MSARLFLLVEECESLAPLAKGQPTEGAGLEVKLSQKQSLTLQQELRSAYGAPSVQRQLAQLQLQGDKSPHFRLAVKNLVRRSQAQVLPKYNFEATDEGVAKLAAVLERYPSSPDAPCMVALLGEALKTAGIMQALPAPAADEVAIPGVHPQAGATAARRSLTRAGAEDLLSQLQDIQGSRRFERLALILSNTKYFPHETSQILPRKFSELELAVYAEVLPLFGFDDGLLGMTQVWRALQPFLSEPCMLEKAQVILQKPTLCGGKGAVPSLTRARAISMQQELLERSSAPWFQVKLNELRRNHHPCSSSFGEHLASLLAPVYAQVLPKYGFAHSEEGLEAVTLAMGGALRELDVQALAAAVDEMLYGPERRPEQADTVWEEAEAAEAAEDEASQEDDEWQPTINNCLGFVEAEMPLPRNQPKRRLSRRQALQLLRQHMAAFSTPDFQHKVSVLRAAAARGAGCDHDARQATRRAKLALTAQRPILRAFGLEAGPTGAHSALQLCAEHVFDPEVARLTAGMHFLLGMEEPACKAIVTRLRWIQAEVSLPVWW